jgi:hypothetical protein
MASDCLEVGDDVRDFLLLLESRKRHLSLRHQNLWIGQVFGKLRLVPHQPGRGQLLHVGGIGESLHRGGRTADDADQMRPNFVLLGLGIMAGPAFVEDLLACGGVAFLGLSGKQSEH